MQFTPQQRNGYKGYSKGVLIGNWSEDVQVMEDKMATYQSLKAQGKLVSKGEPEKVMLSPAASDGFLRFGDVIMIQSAETQSYMAVDCSLKYAPKRNHGAVTASKGTIPSVRNTWVIRRGPDPQHHFYEKVREVDIVHYGQQVRIVNEFANPDGHMSLVSQPLTAASKTQTTGRQEVTAALGLSHDSIFVIEQSDGKQATAPLDGRPIPVDARVVLRHKATSTPLICDKTVVGTSFGGEFEVAAHLAKPQSTRISTATMDCNFWTFRTSPPGTKYVPYKGANTLTALQRVKSKILARGGSQGFRGLVKSFRILDDDGSKTLSRRELKEGMELYGVPLTTSELDVIFKEWDTNGDSTVSITEFLRALRGNMNLRREDLVKEAFKRIDKDGSGIVTFDELRSIYGKALSEHPEVKTGAKTEQEVMRQFIAGWDKSHDGKIELKEFIEYYNDISVNIDDDDYFELMIRNAWHMSGGEGAYENTSCRRVLVVHNDDRQTVEELKDDLGLDATDMNQIIAKLNSQGITDIKRVELTY